MTILLRSEHGELLFSDSIPRSGGFGSIVWCMSRWTAIAKLIEEQDQPDGRRCPRFVARKMTCPGTGVVQDFSASGVRVLYKKRPEFEPTDVMELSLESEVGVHTGEVEVMWVRKEGFRKFQVGFRFTDPEAAKKMQLFKCGYDALDDGYWSAA